MKKMKFNDLKYLIYSDLYRYNGKSSKKKFFNSLISNPGFKYTFYMRLCNYLKHSELNPIIAKPLFGISHLLLRHYIFKLGIEIHPTTQIGSGFYIGHFGCIVIHNSSKIGKNCNISQNITIGSKYDGPKKGTPTIGDGVYIAPGAKIIGRIHIGNNVAIGANAVVTKDVPDNAVVVGVPAKVISYNGANVLNTDY